MNKREKEIMDWLKEWLNQPQKNQDGWWWGSAMGKLMIYPKEKRVEVLEIYHNVIVDGKPITQISINAMLKYLKIIKKLGWKVTNAERVYGEQRFEPRAHSVVASKDTLFVIKGTEDDGPI